MVNRRLFLSIALLLLASARAGAAEPAKDKVPGVVIDHVPAASGLYVGSPSIAILPGGGYVASHDFFGPKSNELQSARTAVFGSVDRGKTWKRLSEVQGAFWSSLFVHRGALYLLGPDRDYGNILIRRSTDGGITWTTPKDRTTGLLRDNGEYHCAPMPVVEHAGRLWRAFEWRNPPAAWGINFRAGMLSVSVDADLLHADNWTNSNFLSSDRAWNGGDMGAWLEGNAVVTPDGQIVDILRVQTRSPDEKAAIVRISADGKTASFDPATGFVDFPGGAKKFAVRFDSRSKLYWSLASIVHRYHRADNPGGIRNTLALTCSADLRHWAVRCLLLYHPDTRKHGFQYVDWLFDGNDMIAACRTAYDDGGDGAHNFHDANFLTFHRISDFRSKTMADSVPIAELPPVTAQSSDFTVTGYGWAPATLADGQTAFGNRSYVWQNVPKQFAGWSVTRTRGGEPATLRVTVLRDTTLYVATTIGQAKVILKGWTPVPGAEFHYTDRGKTPMAVHLRPVKAREEVQIPQGNWTGTTVLLPPPQTSASHN